MAKLENIEAKDLTQKNVSAEMLKKFKKAYDLSKPFSKDVWTTTVVLTLKQFTDKVDSAYKDVTGAYIIAKKRNDNGKIFYKMAIVIKGNQIKEWELTYEKSKNLYEEGDELDPKTLLFCIEEHEEKTHLYATGELV